MNRDEIIRRAMENRQEYDESVRGVYACLIALALTPVAAWMFWWLIRP